MKGQYKVMGAEDLIKKMGKMDLDMEKALINGVKQTANQIRNHAIKSIQKQTIGTYVTRYSQGGKAYDHVASKEGDAPNTDTGALVNSIAAEHTKGKAESAVGSGLEYAKYLEFGTKNMEPRPWLNPALEKNQPNLNDNIINQARRIIEKAIK